MKKKELLVPVGNMDVLKTAIINGADAVYLSGKKFGARAYANNFDEKEMKEAIILCHKYRVKIYVTVNTMIFNEEIEEVMNYLKFLYRNHVDAIIMQDNGLISLVRKYIPDLEIHVSTQAHNHNEAGIQYYKNIGCTRVVFDRESSLEEIKNINVPIEKEVFVYGALCICYSGNCLMSSLNGGRSANRGMCVGSCRLPYTLIKEGKRVEKNYLLSTHDLNTLPKIKEILESDIDSLKIEGRMKSKEYVAVVTSAFRNLIDAFYENKNLFLPKEVEINLLKTYNRGFTNGYLFQVPSIINNKTSNHQGICIGEVIAVNNKKITIRLSEEIHQEDAIRFQKNQKGMYLNSIYNKKGLLINSAKKGEIITIDNKNRWMYDDLIGSKVLKTIDYLLNKELNSKTEKKLPIQLSFQAHKGEPIALSLSFFDKTIKIEEKEPEIAQNTPIKEDKVVEQLTKLGNTSYYASSINISMDSNLFINIKDLNELRRKAIEKLEQSRIEPLKKDFVIKLPPIPSYLSSTPKLSILVRNEEQLKIALKNNIDFIYVTKEELYKKYKTYSNIYLRLERVNNIHKEYKQERLLCTEFGSIAKYNQKNTIRSDYYLNVANDYTICSLKELSCKSVTLSVELSQEQLNKIKNKKDSEVIVYGTLETMIIKNDILGSKGISTYIENENGLRFKILYENGFTHIMNAKVKNEIANLNKYRGFGTWRIELFEEDVITTQKIIDSIKKNLL